MRIIGLTGGIGSGKSTVSSMLAELGYPVIDADAITRDLQQPGRPVLAAMVDAFGPVILHEDGSLDRAAMADIAFSDPDALQRLGRIVHPEVGAEIARRLADLADTDSDVILDVPLLVESGRSDHAELVVVDLDPELAIRRLVESRGVDERDARNRIAHQVSREERLSKATIVIDNHGTIDELRDQVHTLHDRLRGVR